MVKDLSSQTEPESVARPPVTLLRALLMRTVVLALIWWILAGGSPSSWAVGGVAIALSTWASMRLSPPGLIHFSPVGALGFFGFFLWQSLKGGLQVAYLALRPHPDLQPVQMELVLRLQPGPGQLFLASALCLMPGTLALDIQNGQLKLHVLDARMPVEHDVRSAEVWIARMYKQELQ